MNRSEQIRQSRERELTRAHAPLPSPFTTAVVGVTFTSGYPNNVLSLEEAFLNADVSGEALSCVLIRNPDNPFDSNAIEIHVPALGKDDSMIGHITKSMAARLAPELDAGTRWQGWVSAVKIHPEHLDRPGLEVRLERKKDS